MSQRIYSRVTTYQQRKALFEKWEELGNAAEACRQCRVSERLFYYWKKRYEAKGTEGLKAGSHAPKNPKRIASHLASRVVELKKAHSKWGKRRIADEVKKENGWERVISPNTVKRILQEHELWEVQVKKKSPHR